jgi:copper resistance protein B
MSMRRMSTASARRRSLPVIAVTALAACVATHVAAQSAHAPDELPRHEMLEDPFNRSVLFDKLEAYDADGLRWDVSMWAGRAFDRFSVRSQGQRTEGTTEHAEVQLLWTHAVARWWEVVAGARADFAPGPSRNWAAVGIQGLAPFRFGIEATMFVGTGGATAARFDGEYQLLVTNRLILQPHIELDWYGQSDPLRRIDTGLSSVEAGLRLRYEFRRELAPYIGLVRERRFGGTADFARDAGWDADDSSLVVGVRLRL